MTDPGDRPSDPHSSEPLAGIPSTSFLRHMIGAAIVLAGLIAAMYLDGAPPIIYWNWPTLLLVGNVTLGLLFMNFTAGEILRALLLPVRRNGKLAPEELAVCESCMRAGARAALSAGTIGLFVGLIGMLKNLSDVSSIGPNMAAALRSVLYAIILSEAVFIPLAETARRRRGSPTPSPGELGGRTHLLTMLFLSLAAIGCYGFLLLAIRHP